MMKRGLANFKFSRCIYVGGEEWQEKVYDREEWKRLLRTARNHRVLHTPMD
jgi:hypothetical protein